MYKMNRFIILLVCIVLTERGVAQCVLTEFSISNNDKICRNSPVKLRMENPLQGDYYWDFCPEKFDEIPVSQSVSISSFGNGYGYRVVEDAGNYYGFLTSRSLDKLFRLDFGSDPTNSPTVVDLGNPGGLMDAPEGIDFLKDGENWYAFVGKGENSTGQVVKLSFGSNLTATPTATGYGTFGLGTVRIRDLAIVRQDDSIILMLLVYNTSSINRVNFGSTLENTPSANNIVSVSGSPLPRGFSVMGSCGVWRAHIVSESGVIQQVSFGSDILGSLTVEGSFTFSSVIQPWKIRTIYSGGNHYCIISNTNRKYTVINFQDLSLLGTPVEVPNNDDIRFIGLDVLKFQGRTLVQGAGASSSFISVSYENDCDIVPEFSYEEDPPLLNYRNDGLYMIDLMAFQTENQFEATSKALTILDADAPEVVINAIGMCVGNDVRFSVDEPNLISSWKWDFGNGLTSNSSLPVINYAAQGDYSVSLEAVATNLCLTGDLKLISIYDMPSSDFALSPTLLCTNNSFLFPTTTPDIYDGNLSYQWFVDNNPVSTERDLEYNFTTTGPKEIKLKTAIPGCSDEITKTTSPVQPGPVVDFSFTGTCEDELFSFQNETSDAVESLTWDFGNGQTSTEINPSAHFAEYGDFTVSLTATNTIGCENVSTKTLSVRSVPTVDFSVNGPPNACSGVNTLLQNATVNSDSAAITEWLWDPGDGSAPVSQTTPDAQHVFANGGSYPVSLTAITEHGCVGTVDKMVVIDQSPATTFTFTPACDDIPVKFTGPGGNDISSLYWEIGTSYYDGPQPTHTFRSPGNYPVYLEVSGWNGCVATRESIIHVPEPLAPDFSVLRNCVGDEAILTDITDGVEPVLSSQWEFSNGNVSTSSPLLHSFHSPGSENVTLRVTTASGCVYAVTKPVQVLPQPVASFSADPDNGAWPLIASFTNTSSNATQYLWEFADGTGSTSGEASPVYTFLSTGIFPVKLTASNAQQCESNVIVNIPVIAPLPDADIALLTLSPNADGSLKLIATIHNKGNTVIRDLPMNVDLSGKLSLRHIVDGPILPGAKYNAVLGTDILNPQDLQYVCASIDLQNDLNPALNKACEDLTAQLFIFPAYPNPVSGDLHLEWISRGQQQLTIRLTDAVGRYVFSTEIDGIRGFNHRILDLSGIRNGVYVLSIKEGGSTRSQRITILGKP